MRLNIWKKGYEAEKGIENLDKFIEIMDCERFHLYFGMGILGFL